MAIVFRHRAQLQAAVSKTWISHTDVVEDSLVVACKWCCVASDTALCTPPSSIPGQQPDTGTQRAAADTKSRQPQQSQMRLLPWDGVGALHAPSLWELPLPSPVASGYLLGKRDACSRLCAISSCLRFKSVI